MKSIYVGNLPYSTTNEELSALFAQHGKVHSVKLINDRESGRPKGFGFVEMDDAEAGAAMSALDNTNFNGRTIRVNEANARKQG